MIEIALIGNPNSGKTSLFNLMTGHNQRVGNWPGVTVERKSGLGFTLCPIIVLRKRWRVTIYSAKRLIAS